VFLHVGNTVVAEIDGVGKVVVFVEDVSVQFPGVIVPLDPIFDSFQGYVDMETLVQSIPLTGCRFPRVGKEDSVIEVFKRNLARIKKLGVADIPKSLRTIPFVPRLFKSGEAVVHYYMYNFLKDKYQFSGEPSRLSMLCSYQNVVFRNYLVKELIEIIPLDVLRRESYLTVWGTDLSGLSIDETMFRTRREG
jgi:hypothetical protein